MSNNNECIWEKNEHTSSCRFFNRKGFGNIIHGTAARADRSNKIWWWNMLAGFIFLNHEGEFPHNHYNILYLKKFLADKKLIVIQIISGT